MLLLALSSLAAAQPALDARLEAMQASIDALTRTVSAQATELAALKVAQSVEKRAPSSTSTSPAHRRLDPSVTTLELAADTGSSVTLTADSSSSLSVNAPGGTSVAGALDATEFHVAGQQLAAANDTHLLIGDLKGYEAPVTLMTLADAGHISATNCLTSAGSPTSANCGNDATSQPCGVGVNDNQSPCGDASNIFLHPPHTNDALTVVYDFSSVAPCSTFSATAKITICSGCIDNPDTCNPSNGVMLSVKWCETAGGSQCTQIFSGSIPGAPNYEDIEVSGSVRGGLSLVVEVTNAGDTICDHFHLYDPTLTCDGDTSDGERGVVIKAADTEALVITHDKVVSPGGINANSITVGDPDAVAQPASHAYMSLSGHSLTMKGVHKSCDDNVDPDCYGFYLPYIQLRTSVLHPFNPNERALYLGWGRTLPYGKAADGSDNAGNTKQKFIHHTLENGYNYNFWRGGGCDDALTCNVGINNEQPKAQLDVTGDTIVSGTLTAGVFTSLSGSQFSEHNVGQLLTTLPDTNGYGLLCSGWITGGDDPDTYHEVVLVNVANSIARVTKLQDAQYLEIWVGTFPELVIKQSSGVGQTLAWSCQRIS